MPESVTPIQHIEDEDHQAQRSGLVVDDVNAAKEKPTRQSLFAIVTGRLKSVKPRNKQRAKEVAQALADLQEPLMALDELVATLEAERHEELQTTWEQLQTQGRELKRRIENEFTAGVNTSWMNWNAASEKQGRAKGRLQQAFASRRATKLDRYATREQLKAADTKYASAVEALNIANAEHLEAERNKAQAENLQRLASDRLHGIEIAMDRCAAEIAGIQYHDPATGLAVDPTSYLQQ